MGRTGAGKSTLISAVYKTFASYEGQVLIDGVELSDIDLKELRGAMTVIPQDPYLFSASIRSNMDPEGRFQDQEIVQVLEDLQLMEKLRLEGGLQYEVKSGGGNLSQGEKQLLCLARALL